MIRKLATVTLLGAGLILSACGNHENAKSNIVEPTAVFPDLPAPDQFNRAYTMTESPDGEIRIFAKETRDDTDLYEVRKLEDGGWSAPTLLDWPKRASNTNPHFSPFDGRLYFASDRPIAGVEFKRDMNIWSVERTEDGWGEAELVPGDINTGDNETSVSTSADGHMVFVSKHPRGQGGQDLYFATFDEATGEWKMEFLPTHVNSPMVESHAAITPDGQNILYYSHRSPKLGQVDIVAVTRTDEEGLNGWSKPYNLGPLINDADFTFGAGMAANGETFFFSQAGVLKEMPMSSLLELLKTAKAAQDEGKEEEFMGLLAK